MSSVWFINWTHWMTHFAYLPTKAVWDMNRWSYKSMWFEKKAILQSKENLVTNIWSHQYHIFVSNRWCDLLLEIQLFRLYWWSYWTFIHLDLIKEREINSNYESILTIDSFVTSTHPTWGYEAKIFLKWHKLWWWRRLIFTLVKTLHGSVMIKQVFRLKSISIWFGWENTICYGFQ